MKRPLLRLQIIVVVMIVNLGPPAVRSQTSGNQDKNPSQFAERARASMVVLSGEDKDGQPVAPGVGFFIGENLIATDNRVVKSAQRIHARVAAQEWKQVEIAYSDSYRFATILTVTRTKSAPLQVTPLPLADSDKVVVKDKVYLVGDPAPNGAASEGIVNKISRFKDKRSVETVAPYFQITVAMVSSNRGPPVFNRKGEVIGIAAESPDERSLGFAIPASYLTTLLSYRNPGASGESLQPGDKGSHAADVAGASQSRNENSNHQPGSQESASALRSPSITRPVLLNKPFPRYTEEARKNLTQGVVVARVLIDTEGNVKQIRITKGLPDGLIEQAVAAAYQMRFKPAIREGQPVSYWLPTQVEFNLR
jgi:TonB family protein